MIGADLAVLIPEIVLSIYAMAGLMLAVYTTKDGMAPALTYATAAVFAIMALYVAATGQGDASSFGGMIVVDDFARFAKIVILLSAAAILIVGQEAMQKSGLGRFEYPMIVTLAVVGMMIMVSAGDLIVLYMGLELQSLALYVVAALRRDSVRSTEAGLKYFVLGALSSGLLLYGASLVYGFAGTTLFAGIIEASMGGMSLGMVFGLVFMAAGLAFKGSAAPFHMWTPDVYEGSPTLVTALFAIAPKVAAISLLMRLTYGAFGGIADQWQQVLVALSVASMVIGALGAIMQTDIKRMMAYSSIAHMGYATAGLAAGSVAGATGVMIYMTGYVFMGAGTFAIILLMRRDGAEATKIVDLKGLSRTHPSLAVGLLIMMFSMAGIPPLAGFFGKWYVFLAAVEVGLVPLAVIGVVTSVVGAFYYLRIIRLMYFDDTDTPLDAGIPVANRMVLGASLAVVLLFFAGLGSLLGAADTAAVALIMAR